MYQITWWPAHGVIITWPSDGISIIDGGALQRVRCGDVLRVSLTCWCHADVFAWAAHVHNQANGSLQPRVQNIIKILKCQYIIVIMPLRYGWCCVYLASPIMLDWARVVPGMTSKRKYYVQRERVVWSNLCLEVLTQITDARLPSISCCTRAHVRDVLLLRGFCKKSKAYRTYVTKLRFVDRIASVA
jgi:hypothetical protein